MSFDDLPGDVDRLRSGVSVDFTRLLTQLSRRLREGDDAGDLFAALERRARLGHFESFEVGARAQHQAFGGGREVPTDVLTVGATLARRRAALVAQRAQDVLASHSEAFTSPYARLAAQVLVQDAVRSGTRVSAAYHGATHKQFIRIRSAEEPRAHSRLEGRVLPIEEPFVIAGIEVFGPGDEKLPWSERAWCGHILKFIRLDEGAPVPQAARGDGSTVEPPTGGGDGNGGGSGGGGGGSGAGGRGDTPPPLRFDDPAVQRHVQDLRGLMYDERALEAKFEAYYQDRRLQDEVGIFTRVWSGEYGRDLLHGRVFAAARQLLLDRAAPTTNTARLIEDMLASRRERWERLARELGIPVPQAFTSYRGVKGRVYAEDVLRAWFSETDTHVVIRGEEASSWSLKREAGLKYGRSETLGGAMFEADLRFSETLSDQLVDDSGFVTGYFTEHEIIPIHGTKDALRARKERSQVYLGQWFGIDERDAALAAFERLYGDRPAGL
ncbi:hypothetical protein [Deinococcus pimensis]|uniref:hypothetical protein n=1 Tax=Deinococcus pimensis TaxID=309888 RepID=UPI000486F2E8|nr:hypothetical protein [Deinococcus pimensis]